MMLLAIWFSVRQSCEERGVGLELFFQLEIFCESKFNSDISKKGPQSYFKTTLALKM